MAFANPLTTAQIERVNRLTKAMREIGFGDLVAATATQADLSSTANAKGASLIGIEDSGAKFAAGDVEAALAEAKALIDTVIAERTDVATDVGILYHVKVSTAGGATADTDKALPTGTWEFVDAHVLNRGAGTASDTITIKKGASAITNAIDISGADGTVARPSTVDDANISLVGGTNALRITETDGGGSDSPVVDVHVTLRKIA